LEIFWRCVSARGFQSFSQTQGCSQYRGRGGRNWSFYRAVLPCCNSSCAPAMVPFFLLSDRAETWRSSGGVYPPEDSKVSAKPKVVVNTEGVGGETGVFTARFCRVATLVAPQPWFHFSYCRTELKLGDLLAVCIRQRIPKYQPNPRL
jgi:hypothetical protein